MIEKNVIFEIGCEEIPARFMSRFLKELKSRSAQELKAERIGYSKIETYGTYRRLVLYIEKIDSKQEDIAQEMKGPPQEIAFRDGKPTQAALGFAKSAGVTLKELKIKQFGSKNYVVANIDRKGVKAAKLLPQILQNIIKSIYLPLSMRWGNIEYKFIRPIHWIVALYGNQIVRFELAGVKSANSSNSHRFSKVKKVKLQSANIEAYKKKLLKAGVVVDQEERKRGILAQVKKLAPNALVEDDLLNEVNYLVENPVALAGKFDAKYLKLPKEVLITSMKKNQKYFPTLSDGKLESKFVVITDGAAKTYHKNIREGNQKVLSARLEDAKFFFEEDNKVSLGNRVGELEKIAFFEKLGNMKQKTNRVVAMAEFIAKKLNVSTSQIRAVLRAAELCKADLITQMVFEFPTLQGVMGREYVKESKEVGQGIYEHYLPRHAGDSLPQTMPGIIVSLADKLDTLIGCFSLGYEPTGSADPYGLRRAAIGIIAILKNKEIKLNLFGVVDFGYKAYEGIIAEPKDLSAVKKALLKFLGIRLRKVLLDQKVRHDIIDAVLYNYTDVFDIFQKVEAIEGAMGEKWFKLICESADRIVRISKGHKNDKVNPADLEDVAEKELHSIFNKLKWEVEEKVKSGNYKAAFERLSSLSGPISDFFDQVLVMHKDERLKNNRLALLRSIANFYLKIANFSEIQ